MSGEQSSTLNKAVAILDCLAEENTELGVREIARRVNLSSSATGRLLAAMKDLGILSQNPETRAYAIGSRLLTWAGVYSASLDLRNKALPAIHALHQSTSETISLYVLDGDERVCIERLESPHSVRIVARLGRRLPLYAGSAGKAILAYLPPERQEAIIGGAPLQPLTPMTITDPRVLRQELASVRASGCAVSHGEWLADASGVAAPILDHQGQPVGAISISGPVSRFMDESVINRYITEIKQVAAQISGSLGYYD